MRITRREFLLVALAVAWFWGSAWTASKDLPAVADEIPHITGGESYWRYGVNHLQPENSYLAMHWATLPLRRHPPVFPHVPPDMPEAPAMMVVGTQFFYDLGNDPAAMLSAGRAMMAMVGAALVLLIWWWARRLWGAPGGLLAVLLAAFCPTLLAHSGLVMSDVMLSLFLLLTITLGWDLLGRVTLVRVLICGLSLGALLLSKMSGIVAAPMLVVLLVIRLLDGESLPCGWTGVQSAVSGGRKVACLGAAALAVILVAGTVLWAAFGFKFSMYANAAAPSPVAEFTWTTLSQDRGVLPGCIAGLLKAQLLPEIWLKGLAQTTHHLAGRQSFLNGRSYIGGSVAYFPYAWLVKTPLALFGLMALGLAAAVGAARPRAVAPGLPPLEPDHKLLHRAAPLIVLFVIYWIFALTSEINIGHRHLLPIYAPMLILAGGAAGLLRGVSRPARILVCVLVAWFVAESLWVRPRYLSYFNAIAGGPANGYRHLVDSNVDVGQDLIALRTWLEANAAQQKAPEAVFLSFFAGDPVGNGLHATRFGDNGFDARRRTLPAVVHGGLFCISVTLFQGMYTVAPGPWTPEREVLYRQLLAIATSRTPTTLEATWVEQLQFARLRSFLAGRTPTARVGDSILIFRLRDEEVAAALYAPLPEFERLLTQGSR